MPTLVGVASRLRMLCVSCIYPLLVSMALLHKRCLPCRAQAGGVSSPADVGLRMGSRKSPLALRQTQQVLQRLVAECPTLLPRGLHSAAIVPLDTLGDAQLGVPLRTLGQGAFTRALDDAVAAGQLDLAVHSLKDCGVVLPAGAVLGACLPREDNRDALIVSKRLQGTCQSIGDLPRGARVGTGSMRRRAQLLHLRPDLQVTDMRGSVDARLQELEHGNMDATLLALAGLKRLGKSHLAACILGEDDMLPGGCQGAIGVTCRALDTTLLRYLSDINHQPTFLEVACERATLAQLLLPPDIDGAEQQLPPFAIAARATFSAQLNSMALDALVASQDGRIMQRLQQSATVGCVEDAQALGANVGQQLQAAAQLSGLCDYTHGVAHANRKESY